MTTVEEIARILQDKRLLFQVSVPGRNFAAGKISADQALVDCPSLEEYFTRILKGNNAKSIIVKLFTPNGSSYKLRGEHIVSLPGNETVATSNNPATNVATNETNVATRPLHGTYEEPKTPTKAMTVDDQIAFGVLKVEHRLVCHRKDELERDNKALQQKVDKLHDEKLDLVRQNTVQNEKNELEIERAKLNMDKESKVGLSGMLSELKENPELIKAAVGFINPNHPMFKEKQTEPVGELEAKLHDEPEADLILKMIPKQLADKDGELISKMYVVFVNLLAKPEALDKVYNEFNPQSPGT
jgi:hypothetical protein